MTICTFPDGFLWGAATAAHQVEGGNRNDWTEWEHAGRTASRSGRACDHWRLPQFREDIALARRLSLNAYRMSVEWSRVMPDPVSFDGWALSRYRDMAAHCKEQGMDVMVTLHHFTNPLWFVAQGGWEEGPLDDFIRYVEKTVFALDEHVDRWVVLNEPMALAIMGWIIGQWPPGRERSWSRALYVLRRLADVHNAAYKAIRRISDKPVGIAHSMLDYTAASDRLRDRSLRALLDRYGNHWFLRRIRTDFIGVNYYMRECWRVARLFPPRLERVEPVGPVSDYGWEVCPDGLYRTLMLASRYGKPLYVTENGIADAGDRLRADFIREHVHAMYRAVQDGADVRGYFHWSLIDNFEWDQGYDQQFGLIRVDRKDGSRHVRPSAWHYADIARTNAIVR